MNKPRLIDANEFYINYCNMFEKSVDDGEMDRMAYAISQQPTAYDIDKVVERLEEAQKNPNLYVYAWDAYEKAIEIVKGGAE